MTRIQALQAPTPLLQASSALTESLMDDPFYQAISVDFAADLPARRQALTLYFHYSLQEAQRTGRCLLASDPALGAAAWLLPRSPEVDAVESSEKSKYLAAVLRPRGVENYYQIVRYMAALSAKVVPRGAWYLSIIGVLPSAQGRGIGATLLASSLDEASQARATCYLETFTPRNLNFYERSGFRAVATHLEPITTREYVVMRREPEPAS